MFHCLTSVGRAQNPANVRLSVYGSCLSFTAASQPLTYRKFRIHVLVLKSTPAGDKTGPVECVERARI